ncbi:MAG: tRNA (adenosine(37)-N6)-threonylcarbamoyltransferase complex ATPase subunit type 1 TsaE [Clostridiales Family XIII bacterium]|jgi:tRNA threonylcarbamoyladenosine biosynthesis protein TsaE|nr:tRNA (adenosine(37)-N6)-threonylcarbamoyltransferase complex ATPase subunit type 1 TsaE [Clostridiales Family XIII bacterium]
MGKKPEKHVKHVKTLRETREFGLWLADLARAGMVIGLVGGLGMGKTTLVRAIAEGLGAEGPVTSPSFALIHEYGGGRLPLYHFDVYRLGGSDEMRGLGFEEYFYGGGLTVVEWADRVAGFLPPDALVIRIECPSGDICGEERVYTYEC